MMQNFRNRRSVLKCSQNARRPENLFYFLYEGTESGQPYKIYIKINSIIIIQTGYM